MIPSISYRFELNDSTMVFVHSCKHVLFRDANLRPSINFYNIGCYAIDRCSPSSKRALLKLAIKAQRFNQFSTI